MQCARHALPGWRQSSCAPRGGLTPRCHSDSVLLTHVNGSAEGAATFTAIGDPLTAVAHPSNSSRRHADHQCVRHHVLRHHRTRADKAVFAKCDTTDYGRIRSDTRATTDKSAFVLA